MATQLISEAIIEELFINNINKVKGLALPQPSLDAAFIPKFLTTSQHAEKITLALESFVCKGIGSYTGQ